MTRAIFRSTSQAIHFAFIILSYEPSPEGIMSKLIRQKLIELGIQEGTREPSSVDFGGLTALEVRGQAAMIRSAIDSHLPKPETWAVVSRYGQTITARKSDGSRSMSFSPERAQAMQSLCHYLAPTVSGISERSLLWLIARAVGEAEELRPSFRQIGEETGDNRETLRLKYKDVRGRVFRLVEMAIDRLDEGFKAQGVVEPEGPENNYA